MILPSYEIEDKIWKLGYKRICGIDEVGIGAFAGPIVCAGVVVLKKISVDNVRDSKLLSEKQREKVFLEIKKKLIYKTALVSSAEIDLFGLKKAKEIVFTRLLQRFEEKLDYLLFDGRYIKHFGKPTSYVIRGDQKSFSIAAASIVAKVTRDRMMRNLSRGFPEYHFEKHKGYGTKAHFAALRIFGPSAEHRKCYSPIKALLEKGK